MSIPNSSPTTPVISDVEKHRRAQLYARLTYAGVIVVFLSVCAIAVLATMKHESEKEGFRAIHVAKPISFFDYTYVDKNKAPAKKDH
jgi:hypothetical protein